MGITIGVILVALSVVILIFALIRAKKQSADSQPLLEEDTAIQQAFEVIDQFDDHENLSKILISQDPVEIRLAKLFDALFAEGKFAAAEKVARILVDFAPDLHIGYARLGMIQLKMGNLQAAERNLKTALEINPEDVRSANNLGYILNQQKRYAEAVAVLEPVLGYDEENVVTLVNLGIARFHTGNVEGAFELLNSAYKKNPNIPEVHLYIGHCLKHFGEMQKAQIAYQRYEQLKQERENAQQNRQPAGNAAEQSASEPDSAPEVVPQPQKENREETESEEEIVVPETNPESSKTEGEN